MELLPEIENRQSIRKFTNKTVNKEQLKRIVEAGRRAPSAKNRQPWRFVVITDQELKEKIKVAAFNQEYVSEAGAIIAACSTNIDYRMPNGQLSHPIDISFAMAFMMLQAVHEGLGTCVITTFDEQEVKDMLTVPHSMRVILLLLVGHTAETPFPESRKSFERISVFNHW
ncbi:MAG: nitroreductase [Spirochaetales bacterium]|nr:MAG: nitroreductase [Spirochaetales bacterium]